MLLLLLLLMPPHDLRNIADEPPHSHCCFYQGFDGFWRYQRLLIYPLQTDSALSTPTFNLRGYPIWIYCTV
jgi:hypothetical protein